MPPSKILQATLSDMRYLVDSAGKEGWNPGLHDAVPFYFTDPAGFFIEWMGDRRIGCISAPAYTPTYGFMGFYIVEPEMRHKGYGIKLWNHAIAYLGNRAIGLDGVVAQQHNYRKSGFDYHYNNIRFGGKPKGRADPDLQKLESIPFPTLLDYDSKVFGLDRAVFLQHWITMPNSYGLAMEEGGQLKGYGLIRTCGNGCKIGPLFADDEETANALFLGLVHKHEGSDIFLDVVQTHPKASGLASKHGLKKVFETARMYKGKPPEPRLESVYGVTTFELG